MIKTDESCKVLGEALDKMNEWLNERLRECSIEPFSKTHAVMLKAREDAFVSCKVNLIRIIEEILEKGG